MTEGILSHFECPCSARKTSHLLNYSPPCFAILDSQESDSHCFQGSKPNSKTKKLWGLGCPSGRATLTSVVRAAESPSPDGSSCSHWFSSALLCSTGVP